MILILGSNGQVGYELKHQLEEKQHELLTPTRNELDLSNLDAVKAYLDQHQPSEILNAAAYTQVDKAESEPELADQLNNQLPKLLAEYSQQSGAYLLHYSTDYVYAGEGNQPQDESAPLDPKSVYARTKLAGEQAIQKAATNFSILRTSWVYSFRGHNFMNTMLKLAEQHDALRIVDDQIGTPTSAEYLASLSIAVCEQKLKGTYNLTHSGATSWYHFAAAIFEQAQANQLARKTPKLKPITTSEYPTPAKRPLNSRLDCSKLFNALGDVKNSDWQTGLDIEMAKRVAKDSRRA